MMEEYLFMLETGELATVTKYGEDDYSVWIHNDGDSETDGCSVRGTLAELKEEFSWLKI